MTISAEQTWNTCLTHLSDRISDQSLKTWFHPIKPLSLEQSEGVSSLHLQVPDSFHVEWLESHYAALLRKTATDVLGHRTHICYRVDPLRPILETERSPAPPRAPRPDRTALPQQFDAAIAGRSQPLQQRMVSDRAAAPRTVVLDGHLKSEYTFESFIEGDCNRLARSAATAIADRPGGTSFNPFMIYGGVGLGKTHLVQAIANHVQVNMTAERILYVSSEQFTNQFVRSIQENRVSEFSGYYRQIDLLIVDDVQFFSGKEKTQEEFFHIFNDLHQRRKQIVLCADRPPSAISGIEERLLSRFGWGLSADVQAPDLETRIAILQRKTDAQNVSLAKEVIEYVAERIKDNIRQLEGALIRLLAHATLYRGEVDLDTARSLLRDMLDERQLRMEIADIQEIVATHFSVPAELLSARTRKREVVTARHVAMYLSKKLTTHSLKTIGLRFGGRDHSTVIHACAAVEDRLDVDAAFRGDLEELQRRLHP